MTPVLVILLIICTNAGAIEYIENQRPSERLYSIASEFCCNGTIYENKNSTDYECCGNKLIEKSSEICCFPNAYPRKPNTECCYDKIFNTQTHYCNDWTTVRLKPNTRSAVGRPVILPLGTDETTTCGEEVVNLNTDICCNFKIFPNPDKNLECCGASGHVFNPATHVCCRNRTYTLTVPKSKSSDKECCNGEPYDPYTQLCLSEIITEKPTGGIKQCEDIKLYNPEEELCCSNRVIKKAEPDHNSCCGSVSYNSQDYICCEDGDTKKLYTKTDTENKRCCGAELADKNQECCSSRHPFDPKTQTCCELWKDIWYRHVGKVNDGANRQCCGLDALDVKKEECCGTKVIPKSPSGQSGCCSHTTTDLDNEQFVTASNMRYYSSRDTISIYK